MKVLLLENNIINQSVLDQGIDMVKQDLASIKLPVEITRNVTNKKFTTTISDIGNWYVKTTDIAPMGVGYDFSFLIYDATKVIPTQSDMSLFHPMEYGNVLQMPCQWFTTYPRVFADYFLHEICHMLQIGKKDLTHLNNDRNIDPILYDSLNVGQMQPRDFYLYLIKKNMPNITPKYKYFTDKEIVNLNPKLVEMLDKARGLAETPFIITNGFRTPEQNKVIPGSASNSPHMRGLAVDLACNNTTRTKILRGLLTCGIPVFIEVAGGHVHVDIDGAVHPLGDTMWGNDQS